jgi:hypothetical protein
VCFGSGLKNGCYRVTSELPEVDLFLHFKMNRISLLRTFVAVAVVKKHPTRTLQTIQNFKKENNGKEEWDFRNKTNPNFGK